MLATHMDLPITVEHDTGHTQKDLTEGRVLPAGCAGDLALVDVVVDSPQPWKNARALPIEMADDIDVLRGGRVNLS
ncbi:hypothetical protein AA0498_2579 [Acidomonas methanolica]|nr:hypothetical protein AA0498_2579 [Acidomonas methanolica]